MQHNYADPLAYFERYKWYLRSLNAKDVERRRILNQIHEGLISRDTLDPNWQASLTAETEALKAKLSEIESTIDEMPDTPKLMPCKLFLRLRYIFGLSITETAEKLNVSETTLRRIRDTAIRYFEENPPI